MQRLKRLREKHVTLIDAYSHIGVTGWLTEPSMNIQQSTEKLLHEMNRFGASHSFVSGSQALFTNALKGN